RAALFSGFLGFALHRRSRRVLELQPVPRAPRPVARAVPLRHDALEAHLAGVLEYALAIVGEVLVQAQPRKAPTQQARERRLARLQRLAPQVFRAGRRSVGWGWETRSNEAGTRRRRNYVEPLDFCPSWLDETAAAIAAMGASAHLVFLVNDNGG